MRIGQLHEVSVNSVAVAVGRAMSAAAAIISRRAVLRSANVAPMLPTVWAPIGSIPNMMAFVAVVVRCRKAAVLLRASAVGIVRLVLQEVGGKAEQNLRGMLSRWHLLMLQFHFL